jgi:glutamine synthetase
MAGLDGIVNKIDPGQPIDKDLYELPPEEQKAIKQLPGALDVVLDNLEKDHDFLLKGDVFTPDLIETRYKRKNESTPPGCAAPGEFALTSTSRTGGAPGGCREARQRR